MNTRINNLLAIAAGQVGYSRWDDLEQGTHIRQVVCRAGWRPLILPATVSPIAPCSLVGVFAQAAQKMPGLPTASCSVIVSANRNTSRQVSKYSANPGDIVLFDWDPSGKNGADHVGIVELNMTDYLQTIEGNTSLGASGSQGNGGYVARRTRDF